MKISQHKLELMEAISNNIQRERQNKHLSQSKLAALCGVSPSFIKNIENAACHIYFGVVLFLRICKALSVNPAVLLPMDLLDYSDPQEEPLA